MRESLLLMCRLLTYIGKAVNLHTLIFAPDHSIVKQSYQPREMRTGVVNGDGFGVGWYAPEIEDTPAVFKSPMPMWSDLNLPSLSRKLVTPCAFVHVRGASAGMAVAQTNSHPFARHRYLFMHNGMTENFRTAFMREMRRELLDEYHAAIEGTTDSEHIFALFLTYLKRRQGTAADMETCLLETLDRMRALAHTFDSNVVLNLGLTDGETVLVTNYTTLAKGASLSVAEDLARFPQAVVVCSERMCDDPAWQPVPANYYVRATRAARVALQRIP